jgi:hypothetical protein
MDYDKTLELEDGTKLRYRCLITTQCAFCGKWVDLIEFEDTSFGTAHVAPECPEFLAMDAIAFLRENRKVLEGRKADKGFN